MWKYCKGSTITDRHKEEKACTHIQALRSEICIASSYNVPNCDTIHCCSVCMQNWTITPHSQLIKIVLSGSLSAHNRWKGEGWLPDNAFGKLQPTVREPVTPENHRRNTFLFSSVFDWTSCLCCSTRQQRTHAHTKGTPRGCAASTAAAWTQQTGGLIRVTQAAAGDLAYGLWLPTHQTRHSSFVNK